MPRASEAMIRPDLGTLAYEFSLSAAQQGFVGQIVLPGFMTRLQSAQYPVIPAEAILEVGDTLRAPRSAYARGDWEFEWADYTCKENGWEEPLDDTEAAMFRDYFDAEVVAVQRAVLMVLRSQERRVDADPLSDVEKAKEHFRYAVGLKPNALVMDEDVLRHISMCEAVMERVKYTSPNAIRGQLTIEQLKAYFGVENIVVAGAVFNSAKKGKPKQIEAIWPKDKVLLARLSSGGQDLKEPSLGRTFIWEEDAPGLLVTEQYREEQTRSDVYRVRQNTDECVQFAGAGYILTGITA